MGRGRSVLWFATTTRPKRPDNHGRRCQCEKCWPASVSVRAPDAQLALRGLASKLAAATGGEVSGVPPPPAPPPPRETKAEREAKRRARSAAEAKRTAEAAAQLAKLPDPWPEVSPEERAELRARHRIPDPTKGKAR